MYLRSGRDERPSVVWTRGRGCAELAALIGGDTSPRVTGDLAEKCIEHRADLLVSRRFPGSFDLVNVAVPVDFNPDEVTKVTATVAGGPHSMLSADIADRLAAALDVEGEMVFAVRSGDDPGTGSDLLDQIGARFSRLSRRIVEVDSLGDLVANLDEGALLVLGAPGGSWVQRAMLGPGARLKRTAQAGAVVVRSAPDRVFRFMEEPVYVAPLRQADDTLRLHRERTLAVADGGRLVGLVRRERLQAAGEAPVASVMEEAVSVKLDETIAKARELEPTFGPDPIPVTDHEEYLVGALSLVDL